MVMFGAGRANISFCVRREIPAEMGAYEGGWVVAR